MVIAYRSYRDEDWEGICTVFAQSSIEEIKGCCNPAALRPLEFYPDASLIKLRACKICVFDGSNLIGYVAYCPIELVLLSLYILPTYMGKGIGRTLLRIALNNIGVSVRVGDLPMESIEEGVVKTVPTLLYTKGRSVRVICMTNNTRALKLYMSEGFRPVSVYREFLNGYLCFYTKLYLELKGGLISVGSSVKSAKPM